MKIQWFRAEQPRTPGAGFAESRTLRPGQHPRLRPRSDEPSHTTAAPDVSGQPNEVSPETSKRHHAPVLLLPGTPGGIEGALRLARALAVGRDVLAVETDPLAGPSDSKPAQQWSHITGELLAHLEREKLNRFHVVGLSYGGVWAQYLARKVPGKLASLHLVATAPRMRARERAAIDLLLTQLKSDMPVDAILRGLVLLLLSPQYLARPGAMVLLQLFASDLTSTKAAMQQKLAALRDHDGRGWLMPLSCPIHIYVGERDWLFPPDLAAEFRRSVSGSFTQYPGAGHLLWIERAKELVQAIAAAIRF